MRIEAGPRVVLSRRELELLLEKLDTSPRSLAAERSIALDTRYGRFTVTAEETHVHQWRAGAPSFDDAVRA